MLPVPEQVPILPEEGRSAKVPQRSLLNQRLGTNLTLLGIRSENIQQTMYSWVYSDDYPFK